MRGDHFSVRVDAKVDAVGQDRDSWSDHRTGVRGVESDKAMERFLMR